MTEDQEILEKENKKRKLKEVVEKFPISYYLNGEWIFAEEFAGTYSELQRVIMHICTSCYHPLPCSPDNPLRTDWCAICGHREEGQKRVIINLG